MLKPWGREVRHESRSMALPRRVRRVAVLRPEPSHDTVGVDGIIGRKRLILLLTVSCFRVYQAYGRPRPCPFFS